MDEHAYLVALQRRRAAAARAMSLLCTIEHLIPEPYRTTASAFIAEWESAQEACAAAVVAPYKEAA